MNFILKICISSSLLSQQPNFRWFSEPIGGEITIASESTVRLNTPKTTMEKALDEQLNVSKFSTPSDKSQTRGCYYTSIPRVIKRQGIHAQQLTSLNLDKVRIPLSPCRLRFWNVQYYPIWLCTFTNILFFFFLAVGLSLIYLDAIVRKCNTRRLWRFWGHASWGAAICLYCICGE